MFLELSIDIGNSDIGTCLITLLKGLRVIDAKDYYHNYLPLQSLRHGEKLTG